MAEPDDDDEEFDLPVIKKLVISYPSSGLRVGEYAAVERAVREWKESNCDSALILPNGWKYYVVENNREVIIEEEQAFVPFRRGDRVRMTLFGRQRHPHTKLVQGTVLGLDRVDYGGNGYWAVRIKRGVSKSHILYAHYDYDGAEWELVPVTEISLDEVSTRLAKAVLEDRDDAAALALADRVIELLGGTPKEPS